MFILFNRALIRKCSNNVNNVAIKTFIFDVFFRPKQVLVHFTPTTRTEISSLRSFFPVIFSQSEVMFVVCVLYVASNNDHPPVIADITLAQAEYYHQLSPRWKIVKLFG